MATPVWDLMKTVYDRMQGERGSEPGGDNPSQAPTLLRQPALSQESPLRAYYQRPKGVPPGPPSVHPLVTTSFNSSCVGCGQETLKLEHLYELSCQMLFKPQQNLIWQRWKTRWILKNRCYKREQQGRMAFGALCGLREPLDGFISGHILCICRQSTCSLQALRWSL